MARFLAEEDIPRAIVRGVKRRKGRFDIVRVQDVGLGTKEDPEILELAAREGRIVILRDISTMPVHAAERIRQGKTMPGLLVVTHDWRRHIRQIIEDLLLIEECSSREEWEKQVFYLPL